MRATRGWFGAILLGGALTWAMPLLAHDIAIFPEIKGSNIEVAVKYGHPGDYSATALGKLIELQAFPPSGEPRPLAGRLRVNGDSLLMAPMPSSDADAGTWVFASFYDNGFFLRTADDRSVNTTRAEYPAARSVTHNMKFGKGLLRVSKAGAGFDRVVGHRLELVPGADPFGVKSGDGLQIAVRFDGKPLPGASLLLYTDNVSTAATKHVASGEGVVEVPIRRSGLHILSVEHGVPSRHPDLATRDAYAASLTFTLP